MQPENMQGANHATAEMHRKHVPRITQVAGLLYTNPA